MAETNIFDLLVRQILAQPKTARTDVCLSVCMRLVRSLGRALSTPFNIYIQSIQMTSKVFFSSSSSSLDRMKMTSFGRFQSI